eukprot:368684-Pyramimonas_sp.AAC.1
MLLEGVRLNADRILDPRHGRPPSVDPDEAQRRRQSHAGSSPNPRGSVPRARAGAGEGQRAPPPSSRPSSLASSSLSTSAP